MLWRFNFDPRHLFFLSCFVNMNSVSLALNKWPRARCAPWVLTIMGSRRRLLAQCRVRRAESYPLSTGQTDLFEWRKKSGQQRRQGREGDRRRVVRGEKSVSSLKERNGRIGAFPPRGYSTFMTRQRDRKEWGEKKRRQEYVNSLCLCLHITIKIGTSV